MAATGRFDSASRISTGSQLLAIGSGFLVLIVLSALFVVVQKRRRRRQSASWREFHSPLIQTFSAKTGIERSRSRQSGESRRSFDADPQSPSSDSSNSPQCTPLTPYAAFGVVADSPLSAVGPTVPQLTNDRGTISLSLAFDPTTSVLQVTILGCHNLPETQNGSDGQCLLNPYVKLRLLPNNQHRVKTRVLRGTRNPFYDEQFTMYGVSAGQFDSYYIHLAVLGADRFSRDVVLGETFFHLSDFDCGDVVNDKHCVELPLFPRPAYTDLRTQLLLSMAFNAQTNSVNVAILKLKDLPCDEKIGAIDPYVKVYMLLNGQRVAKHKTHVKKRCTEAVFNESFAFDLPTFVGGAVRMRSAAEVLDSVSFEVQILNHDGVTRSELVGHCFVGPDSKHWMAVRDQPGQLVAEWHKIHSF